jgi:DNA-directed RNA polymerase II subunit RPB1
MSIPTSCVDAVSFSVCGSAEARQLSNVQVTNSGLFKAINPIDGGVYDSHMGTTSMQWACHTCFLPKAKCPGHFGSIDMPYPVKNPMFKKYLLQWLNIICLDCSALLADNVTVHAPRTKLLANYVKISKDIKKCPQCNKPKYTVRKHKIEQVEFYVDMRKGKESLSRTLFNHEIKRVLDKISDETVEKLRIPQRSHPRHFVLDSIRCPPNSIRPDIRRFAGGRTNNHTTTAMLKAIMEIRTTLPASIPEPAQINDDLHKTLNNLDLFYNDMIKGSTTANNQMRVTMATRAPSSIASLLPQKQGRLRRNLLGKKVYHVARSVITGDPSLRIDELGFPKSVARTLSIPEVVRPYNRHILEIYYRNGRDVYPGCEGIRKANGKMYDIRYLDPKYELQDGDVVYRDVIDGDVVIFNRAPSLTWTSTAGHKVVIIENSNTLRTNVSVCSLYNADFDGDAMMAVIPRNPQSRNEVSFISSVENWFVSHKNSAPIIGAFQDTLVGAAEFTTGVIKINKWHAMALMSGVDVPIAFDSRTYTNRDMVSMLLPYINLERKPKIYMEQFAAFLNYDPQDIKVKIKSGKLISGILDKSTVGQSSMGSIFHIINNEYGARKALAVVFHLQQLISSFLYYRGFTTGISDLVIPPEALLEIKQKIADMVLESQRIIDRMDRGNLIPPIGTTQREFLELEQMNALEQGDEFIAPILSNIDLKTNGLAKLVFSGSKGNANNIIAINGALGSQKIGGRRPTRQFSRGRTSPYFRRDTTSPESLGYVSTSYRQGIPSRTYPFAANTAREGVITIALMTSVTGHQNRVAIKNMETILVNNLRHAAKFQGLVQTLCLETGIDPRRTEECKFFMASISDEEMAKYHVKVASLPAKYRNDAVQKELDAEYAVLMADREEYRSIMLRVESNHQGQSLFDDRQQMPVNVKRIITDTAYNFDGVGTLDPVRTILKVRNLCDTIDYVYFNEAQERRRMPIPRHISCATTFVKILLRSYLCVHNLMMKGITDALLDVILDKVKLVFARSLIQYGTAIGIISAQSISEPMTQMSLDTKHRAGAGSKSMTNPIVRIMEIIGVRPTKSMKNPSLVIMVREQYEDDKLKVQEIANHLKMMQLSIFVQSTRIFFEKFGKPTHPKFKHEAKMIKRFLLHAASQPPADLSMWCIRFTLNREEMIINNMSVERIIRALRIKYDMYFVYTPENAADIIIRCYIRSGMLKASSDEAVIGIMKALRSTVISGVHGIRTTKVIDYIKSYRTKDGIKRRKSWAIATIGTNLEEVMTNPYVDPYRTQTDSITEFSKIFGIEAARNKVIAEMLKTIDANRIHCTLYGDEMSFTGQLSSIQKSGMNKRDMDPCLRMAFQSPNQVIEEAAVYGLVSKINGLSAPLIVGAAPKVGTAYNGVVVNEKFVKEHANTMDAVEDEL